MDKSKFKPLVIIRSYEDRNAGGKEFTQKIAERLSSSIPQKETPQEKSTTPPRQNNPSATVVASPPPPPPPLPKEESQDNVIDLPSPTTSTATTTNANVSQAKTKSKAPPPPVPNKATPQPPPCPPPDYDTMSIKSTSTLPKKIHANGLPKIMKEVVLKTSQQSSSNDSVEMESLESFKLNGPAESKPKPPNTYFNRPKSGQVMNGSATLTKQRPVSVTIGEYPSGTSRKQPGKLGFLQNGHDSVYRSPSDSISSQFASELAQTLSRSNLKKRTESMENLLSHPQIKPESNGSVRISVSNSLSKHFAKSTSDLTSLDTFSKTLANRVTINISSNDKKAADAAGAAPNGILKNGAGNHSIPPSHRQMVHQKSITFGDMPTVINDHPLRVT